MNTPETPQVRVPGSENPDTPQNPPSHASVSSLTMAPAPLSSLTFGSFLTSPIVEIVVGKGENETVLTAHQNLLLESPFLAALVEAFEPSGPRRITLPDENVDAFGCFLQFQYTRDYSVSRGDTPTDSGEQLLRHARIYTLAEKLRLPALKNLAHSKIHRIDSTPSDELCYARYVYTNTLADDIQIRKPIAHHWGQRSHMMRHEVGDDFKKLCIEVPEFAFDVLTHVLDRREKARESEESATKGSARKRLRNAA